MHSIAYFISNMLGVVFNALQLGVWGYYVIWSRKAAKTRLEAARNKTPVGEQEVGNARRSDTVTA